MRQPDYRFAPVTRDHLPLLRRWLGLTHVRRWWGDPETELAMIAGDLDREPTDMRIVTLDDRPIAYVQDYPAHHWPMPHYAHLPAGTRALDTFLGEPALLGCGHGRGYLRARVADLLAAGASMVVVDPDPRNVAAVAAYRAAGFAGADMPVPSEDGEFVLVLTAAASVACPA
jgi:aminoglycoside 6'-N-acetyltransferase